MKHTTLWDKLLEHRGHDLTVVSYGDADRPANVSLECNDCCQIVLDAEIYDIHAVEELGTNEKKDTRPVTMADFVIGQEVAIIENPDHSNSILGCKVEKIGRKYVTTTHGYRFKVAEWNRDALTDDAEYGYRKYLFPSRQAAHDFIIKRENEQWVYRNLHRVSNTWTADQVRRIREIMEEKEEGNEATDS